MAFDIDTYVKHSASLATDDLDFEAFREQPLDAATLRCLRYMHDVEFHTVCYLRDLLVTRAHADPEVTTFLTFWAWEEHFHGDAIAKVLRMHDEMAGRERVQASRINLKFYDRFKPLMFMMASAALKDLIAIQMSIGALNEYTTQAGYARVIAKSGHPMLTTLLKRIMKQEGRHIDFYSTKANERLTTSRAARQMTRLVLNKFWTPVGAGVMPPGEVQFLISHLFGDVEGLKTAQRIDRHMDRFPGLAGLHLVERAIARYSYEASMNQAPLSNAASTALPPAVIS